MYDTYDSETLVNLIDDYNEANDDCSTEADRAEMEDEYDSEYMLACAEVEATKRVMTEYIIKHKDDILDDIEYLDEENKQLVFNILEIDYV